MSLHELDRGQLLRLMEVGRKDPAGWIERILGAQLWQRQRDIANSVRDNRNTLVESCQGTGKTFSLAATVLAFLYSYPHSRVITTAPTFRQVKSILWAEIHRQQGMARLNLGGSLNQVDLEISSGWYAQGLSTNKPERFQGQHALYILFIVDECYGVAGPIFDAIRGAMSAGIIVRLLAAGNPTDPGAYVVEASRKTHPDGRPVWHKIHISAWDSPNFKTFGITKEDILTGRWVDKLGDAPLPAPHLITPEFVAEMAVEWGVDSPAWTVRIEGRLPDQSTDTVIPLAWVEAAMERWEYSVARDAARETGELADDDEDLRLYVPLDDPTEIGVDVARFGDDETVIAPRRGRRLLYLRCYRKQDTMQTTGRVIDVEADLMPELHEPLPGVEYERPLVKVDSVGVGAGVYDRLNELERNVMGFDAGRAPMNPRKFADITSEWWWHLRELLRPSNRRSIALPRDGKLLGDLTGRKWKITSDNRIKVEPKEEYKKRLGRSPDRGDAVVNAYAPVRPGGIIWLS